MKGFASICVVLGHIAVGYLDQSTFPQAYSFLFVLRNVVYIFHMSLFMMISGYVYSVAYSDAEGIFDQKRVYTQTGNLIAVYVVWSLLTGISRIILSQFVDKKVSLQDVLLIAVKPINPYWYIYVLIFFYLIFSAGLWNWLDKWKALGICSAICITGNFIHISWLSFSNLLYYTFFFYIGIAYKKNKRWIIGNQKLTIVSFVVAILLVFVYWDREQVTYISSIPLVRLFIALGFSLALWYFFEHVKFLGENKLLCFCGRYSLEIYVMHNFFTSASRQLPKLGITNVYLVTAIAFTAGILAPILFSVLCKKMKIYNFFFKPFSYSNRSRTDQ